MTTDESKELITSIRRNELEFPSEVSITYANIDNDYQIGTEVVRRQTAKHENKIVVNLALALTPDEAIKIAEIALNSAWYTGRYSYSFSTNYSQLILSPGDIVTIPLNTGQTETVKITNVDYGPTGMINYEAVPELTSLYTATSPASTATYISQAIESIGPTRFELIDSCMLRDADTELGWYVALSGYSTGWPGAVVLKSSDGGATWNQVSSNQRTTMATVGTTTTLLANADCRVWDKTNTVTVRLAYGELFSATEVNVLNGANAALVGANGRWELIQWLTATLNGDGTYTLSNLLRGRKGTEHAASVHTTSDSFILLSATAIKNTTVTSSELNAVKQYKAVTSGTAIESVTGTNYTYTGERLKPLAPVLFRAYYTVNEDINMLWSRRDRVAKAWSSSTGLPLSETSEAYEIDIILDSVLKRTLSVTSESATYTAAQQVTDGYDTAGVITFNLYQISSTVGRGRVSTISGPKTMKIASSMTCSSTLTIQTQMGTQNATAAVSCTCTMSAYPNDLPRTVILLHCNESVGSLFISNSVSGEPSGVLGTDVQMSISGAKFGSTGTAHQGINYSSNPEGSLGKGSIKLAASSENCISDNADFCYEFFFYPFTLAGDPYSMHGGWLLTCGSTEVFINGSINRIYIREITQPWPTYSLELSYNILSTELLRWRHLAYTKEGTTYRLFIEGVKVAEQTANFSRTFGDLFIGGGDGYANSFAGYIDEIRVTRGTAVYPGTGFTPPTTELSII